MFIFSQLISWWVFCFKENNAMKCQINGAKCHNILTLNSRLLVGGTLFLIVVMIYAVKAIEIILEID